MRWLLFSLVAATPLIAAAQDKPATAPPAASVAGPLFEHEPYDELVLNDKTRTTLRVTPLDLPGRKVPASPDPKSLLGVRLFDRPAEPYNVAWGDVAEIRLFEQLVLAEAANLTAARRFNEAFEHYLYLRREHPKLPGLEDAETALIVAEAEAALEAEQPELALARLLRLEQRNELHPQLVGLLARTTEQLVEQNLKIDRPRGARIAVEQFARGREQHATAVKLKAALAEEAEKQLAAARQALEEARYHEARRAAQAAALLAVDPAPATEVFKRAVEAHPAAIVGVVETAVPPIGNGAPSWAARRVAALERIAPLELVVTSGEPSRANYSGGANRWTADDRDPLSFQFTLAAEPGGLTAADVARALLSRSPPGLELRVVDPLQLEMRFARPQPRPEARIADILSTVGLDAGAAPYRLVSADGVDTWRRNDSLRRAGPIEIVERRFADEEQAAAALLAGDVDLVDRVAPWQAARLRERRELQLVRYAAPSIHLLLFNENQPLLRSPEMRRAVGYALDRESILRNHLQPEAADLATRVVDGPFPIGRGPDDPLGYASDPTGASRPYDPQRALVLAALAGGGGAAEGAAAARTPLTLAHPATATATKACRRIAAYLENIGIAVELRPAAADASPTSPVADLTYVVVSATEPLVDADRWFGPGGLVNLDSRALEAAVARLRQAESIGAARTALFEVERVLHDEALVVPLWQLTEHAVLRRRIVAPSDVRPTSLYQQVDRWQVLPQFSEALP